MDPLDRWGASLIYTFLCVRSCDAQNHTGDLECIPVMDRVSLVGTLNIGVYEALFFLFNTNTSKRMEERKYET